MKGMMPVVGSSKERNFSILQAGPRRLTRDSRSRSLRPPYACSWKRGPDPRDADFL